MPTFTTQPSPVLSLVTTLTYTLEGGWHMTVYSNGVGGKTLSEEVPPATIPHYLRAMADRVEDTP